MTKRERIKQKYNGKCAYSGTELEWDWQIDHIKPLIRDSFCKTPLFKNEDVETNCVPCQKAINQYKHAYELETFRGLLMTLHKRIKPTPRTPERIARKERLMKIAGYFGITPDKPFDGIFYFETRSFHSLEEQEEFDRVNQTDKIKDRMRDALVYRVNKLKTISNYGDNDDNEDYVKLSDVISIIEDYS